MTSPRHSLLLLTVLLMAAAPAVGASEGQLTATRVESGALPLQASAYLVGLKQGWDDASVDWEGSGNVTIDMVAAEGASYLGIVSNRGDTTQVRSEHAAAHIRSLPQPGTDTEFFFAVEPLETSFRLGFRLDPSELTPVQAYEFHSEAAFGALQQAQDDLAPSSRPETLSLSGAQPNLGWDHEAVSSEWTFEGDFVLYVYQTGFEVEDAEGATTYATGEASDGATPVGEISWTRAEITFRDATLRLAVHERHAQVALADAASTLTEPATFYQAEGVLRQGEVEHQLNGDIRVDPGRLGMTLAPLGGVFDIHLSGSFDAVSIDGRGIAMPPASIAGGSSDLDTTASWPWLAALAVAVAGFGALLRRHHSGSKGPVRLAEAQMLFDLGHYDDALRASRSVLRRDRTNMDAVTVAVLSLLRAGNPQGAARMLEAVPTRGDGLLGVLRALVLRASGRLGEAEEVLVQAFRDNPDLAEETMAVDLLDQLRMHKAAAA